MTTETNITDPKLIQIIYDYFLYKKTFVQNTEFDGVTGKIIGLYKNFPILKGIVH